MKNIEEAKIAYDRAYAPYSNFKVGAAILLKNGKYIHGSNVENGSFGLSNCAERSALFSLYSQGYKKDDIISITVIANHNKPISPCGACRQVMSELLPKGTKIILTNLNGEIKETSIDELLPYSFELEEEK